MLRVQVAVLAALSLSLASCISSEPEPIIDHALFCDESDLERLMTAGVDPNAPVDGRSAVWRVVGSYEGARGCLGALEVLIEAGGTVERVESGWSIFGVAALREVDEGMFTRLAELGANPCGDVAGHVNLSSSAFDDFEPQSLLEVSERFGSEANYRELVQVLDAHSCGY